MMLTEEWLSSGERPRPSLAVIDQGRIRTSSIVRGVTFTDPVCRELVWRVAPPVVEVLIPLRAEVFEGLGSSVFAIDKAGAEPVQRPARLGRTEHPLFDLGLKDPLAADLPGRDEHPHGVAECVVVAIALVLTIEDVFEIPLARVPTHQRFIHRSSGGEVFDELSVSRPAIGGACP